MGEVGGELGEGVPILVDEEGQRLVSADRPRQVVILLPLLNLTGALRLLYLRCILVQAVKLYHHFFPKGRVYFFQSFLDGCHLFLQITKYLLIGL